MVPFLMAVVMGFPFRSSAAPDLIRGLFQRSGGGPGSSPGLREKQYFGRGNLGGLSEKRQFHSEIVPTRIVPFDQRLFPVAPPKLELGLAGDGFGQGLEFFEMDQLGYSVFCRVSTSGAEFVLTYAVQQIARHTNVDRCIRLAGHNVCVECHDPK